jgi:hypothetical protein
MRKLWSDPDFLRRIQGMHGAASGASGDPRHTPLLHASADGPAAAGWSVAGKSNPAGPRAVAASPSTPDRTMTLLKDLEELEKALANHQRQGRKDKVKETQAKIDSILKQLALEGEVVVVSGAGRPPSRPSDGDGEIEYEGIPLERITHEPQRNQIRRSAKRIREGIARMDDWAERLDETTSEHTARRHQLNTVMDRSEDVSVAFAQDLRGGKIEKLSKAAGADFELTLASYEQAASDVKMSVSNLREQAYRIAAAQAMVRQAEILIEAYHQEKERDAQGKKLAELKEKLDKLKAGVNFVIGAIKDPKGAAKDLAAKAGIIVNDYLVDSIVDGLLGGEKLKQEMAKIEARLAAIHQRLDELKLGELTAGLNQAWGQLNAEAEKTKVAQEALTKAKRAQGHAVDVLAGMERNHPGTTTVFGKLQQHYAAVQQAGKEAMELSKQHERDLLAVQEAMSYTSEIRQTVQSDRAMLNRLYPLEEVSLEEMAARSKMDAVIHYTKAMDAWYQSKKVDQRLDEERQRRDALRSNQQFDYFGRLVNDVQEDGLGHVQRDEQIANYLGK